jgi:long-subunit fatty acid transport protein
VAFGVGHDSGKRLTIDAGVVGAIHRSRSIDNDVGAPVASADGRYQTFWFVLGLSLTYRR